MKRMMMALILALVMMMTAGVATASEMPFAGIEPDYDDWREWNEPGPWWDRPIWFDGAGEIDLGYGLTQRREGAIV